MMQYPRRFLLGINSLNDSMGDMRAVYFEQIGLVRRLFNLNDMSECLLKD